MTLRRITGETEGHEADAATRWDKDNGAVLASRSVLIATALVLLAAYTRKVQPESSGDSQNAVIYSASGWSQAERDEYYHLAEGR